MRRGFLAGLLDLIGSGLAVLGGVLGYAPVATWLSENVPGLPPEAADVIALLGLTIVIQAVYGMLSGRLVRAAYPVLVAVGPLFALDRVLGLLPGLARGLILVTLVLLPFALLPLSPVVGNAIEQSSIASHLVGLAMLGA